MNPDQGVMAGIVVRRPAENLDSDLLLAKGAVRVMKTAFSQIKKELPQALRFLEVTARRGFLQYLARTGRRLGQKPVLFAHASPPKTPVIISPRFAEVHQAAGVPGT